MGSIPAEWEIVPLVDVVDFLDGYRRPVKDSERSKMQGEIPYYGASGIVDYVNDFLFDDDLILLGEDGENILSRNCRLAFKVSGKAWVNNHAHVLKPKAQANIDYLVEYLESLDYGGYNTGTAQPKLNKQVCTQIPVLVPPLPEQSAIATALSDVDALLSSLDALIAKKRDIKQAAMQQLLTGKIRLPGFESNAGFRQTEVGVIPKDWEVSTVGRQFDVTLGKMLDAEKNIGELKPYIGNRNVRWGSVSVSELPLMRLTRADMEKFRLRNGDLLVCEGGDVGRAAIWDAPVEECYYQKALHRLRPLRGFNSRLMVGLLRLWSDRGTLANYVTQTSIAHLPREKFMEIPMPVPSSLEQTAIAEVLAEMDAEQEVLEARRDKTRLLKQGMMQELLTGKTRLV
ncbi:restriction endonuclease subunit S [Burkholderia cepacia]|uniref:restriction endonuclease subunit S n=1 Tax=Burkholderia cepacia TaxID=292 RepID=UPI0015777320|nr:restriction endonuclease subunit S [Burkholderia cepacia]